MTSDGTAAGTTRVRDIFPGSPHSTPNDLTCCGGTVFFTADDGRTGVELWRSDGTSSGTWLVKDLRPGTASSAPSSLTCCEGTLFLAASGSNVGRELWKSDGTASGTTLVADIEPGAASSSPSHMKCFGAGVYFRARGPSGTVPRGAELWFSDGSDTQLVCDIRPGEASSSAANVSACFGALYVAADDGVHGMELHVIDLPGASVRTLGQGGANAYSTLTSTNPILGRPATHRFARGPTGHVGYLLLSAPAAPYTVPGVFRGNASAFLDLPTLAVVAATSPPQGSVALAIPNAAALNGMAVHTQMCWISASAPIELTNGLELNLGL